MTPPIPQVFEGHPATRAAIKASGRERTGTVTVNDGAVAGGTAMTTFVYGFVLHGLASTVRAHRCFDLEQGVTTNQKPGVTRKTDLKPWPFCCPIL
jgi:hypothetical protein